MCEEPGCLILPQPGRQIDILNKGGVFFFPKRNVILYLNALNRMEKIAAHYIFEKRIDKVEWTKRIGTFRDFTGAPNDNFRKLSVRKTICDLQFSEQLL